MTSHTRRASISAEFRKDAYCDDPKYFIAGLRKGGLILLGADYVAVVDSPLCDAVTLWYPSEECPGDIVVEQPKHSCASDSGDEPPVVRSISWIEAGLWTQSFRATS